MIIGTPRIILSRLDRQQNIGPVLLHLRTRQRLRRSHWQKVGGTKRDWDWWDDGLREFQAGAPAWEGYSYEGAELCQFELSEGQDGEQRPGKADQRNSTSQIIAEGVPLSKRESVRVPAKTCRRLQAKVHTLWKCVILRKRYVFREGWRKWQSRWPWLCSSKHLSII